MYVVKIWNYLQILSKTFQSYEEIRIIFAKIYSLVLEIEIKTQPFLTKEWVEVLSMNPGRQRNTI